MKRRIIHLVFIKHQYSVGDLRSAHFRAIPLTLCVEGRNGDGGGSMEVRFADRSATTCTVPLENLRYEENSSVCMMMVEQKDGFPVLFMVVFVWVSVNVSKVIDTV